MKVFETDKPHSWLSWPVTVKSCSEPSLHVTAKFFGPVHVNVAAVRQRLDKVGSVTSYNPVFLRKAIRWEPAIFDHDTKVLELVKFPKTFGVIHNLFAIVEDQHTPWRPHLTVPAEYAELVAFQNLSPLDEELSFGEIELHLRKR